MSDTRAHTIWFCLYEISRKGKISALEKQFDAFLELGVETETGYKRKWGALEKQFDAFLELGVETENGYKRKWGNFLMWWKGNKTEFQW